MTTKEKKHSYSDYLKEGFSYHCISILSTVVFFLIRTLDATPDSRTFFWGSCIGYLLFIHLVGYWWAKPELSK